VPELREPLDPATAATLRAAVLGLRTAERRRVFGPVLHVGRPGGPVAAYAVDVRDRLDPAVRTDLVGALLRRLPAEGPAPLAWLTRAGELALHDEDAAWLAAARQAFAESGRPLTLVVVTRRGWWDPRSGLRREWKRLRAR
jgi:hypothetical protein